MKIFSNLSILLLVAILAFVSCAETLDSNGTDITDADADSVDNPGVQELVYFWFFSNELPNDTEMETIDATFPSSSNAFIEYTSSLEGYPNTSRDGSMERRNMPTDINYRPGGNNNVDYENAEGEMRAIQVRDPFVGSNGENTMVFHLPTNGYRNVVFTLAAKDEDAAVGLIFDYSVSSASPSWTTEGLSPAAINQDLITDEYRLFEIPFEGITEVNDNENFKVRLRFETEDGQRNEGNRVTFNNVALDGVAL